LTTVIAPTQFRREVVRSSEQAYLMPVAAGDEKSDGTARFWKQERAAWPVVSRQSILAIRAVDADEGRIHAPRR
jgi:hypothetical protein